MDSNQQPLVRCTANVRYQVTLHSRISRFSRVRRPAIHTGHRALRLSAQPWVNRNHGFAWWEWQGSNLHFFAYEAKALPVELHSHTTAGLAYRPRRSHANRGLPAPGCIYSPVAAVYLRAMEAIRNGMGWIALFVGFVRCAGVIASAQSGQIVAAKARVKQRRMYMIQANGSSFPMDESELCSIRRLCARSY